MTAKHQKLTAVLSLALAGSFLGCGADSRRPVIGGGGTSGGGEPCVGEVCQQDDDDGVISQEPLNRIAFVSNRSGSDEIWMMDPDGSHVERLTSIAEEYPGRQYEIGRVARSPDGGFVFDSNLDGDWDIYILDPDGSMINLTQEPVDTLTGKPVRTYQDRNPAFLPDGTLLYDSDLEGNGDIFLLDLDIIIEGPINLTENGAIDASPSSSSDGRHIAFTSTRSDPYPEIHIMDDLGDVYGGTVRRLLPEGGFSDGSPCFAPRWSPDGEWIVCHCEANGNVDVYKITADGSRQGRLTSDPAPEHSPTYSLDGTQIACVCEGEGGNQEICVMNETGTDPINVTNNPAEDHSPAWW